jgi:hypothetical protein
MGGGLTSLGHLQRAREHSRHKTFQLAELRTRNGNIRVHILDISSGGVRLHAAAELEAGGKVLLVWNGQSRSAQVAWHRNHKYGLRFTIPLRDDQVEAFLIRGSAPGSTPAEGSRCNLGLS